MNFLQIDNARLFQAKGEVSPIRAAGGTFAVGNNQPVITAVSGYRLRAVGWQAQSDSAAGVADFVLKNGSGGAMLHAPLSVPALPGVHNLPISYGGYFEADTNTAVVVDVTTNTIRLTVFYVSYIP